MAMNEEVLFVKVNRAVKQRRPPSIRFAKLSDGFETFLKRCAKPAQRNATVPQAFAEAVGETMAKNCKIESITQGTLKIKVAPGPCLFAMQMQLGEILEKIQTQCPSSKIREIKLICL